MLILYHLFSMVNLICHLQQLQPVVGLPGDFEVKVRSGNFAVFKAFAVVCKAQEVFVRRSHVKNGKYLQKYKSLTCCWVHPRKQDVQYFGLSSVPSLIVTTGILTFLVGRREFQIQPSFATMTGKEDNPTYTRIFQVCNFCCLFTKKAYQKAAFVTYSRRSRYIYYIHEQNCQDPSRVFRNHPLTPPKRYIYIYICKYRLRMVRIPQPQTTIANAEKLGLFDS